MCRKCQLLWITPSLTDFLNMKVMVQNTATFVNTLTVQSAAPKSHESISLEERVDLYPEEYPVYIYLFVWQAPLGHVRQTSGQFISADNMGSLKPNWALAVLKIIHRHRQTNSL